MDKATLFCIRKKRSIQNWFKQSLLHSVLLNGLNGDLWSVDLTYSILLLLLTEIKLGRKKNQLNFTSFSPKYTFLYLVIYKLHNFYNFRPPTSCNATNKRACLKRRHVYVAVWPSGRVAEINFGWCLRRWPQPQGQTPQK